MRGGWNKGLTKETDISVRRISETMRARKIDNFKQWREVARRTGRIKSSYPSLQKNGDTAELIGVILGDGHIAQHPRCESLRIVGNANSSGFKKRYAALVEAVFKKKPNVSLRSKSNAYNITLYEKHISKRLGIPTGARGRHKFLVPNWIQINRQHRVRFLRGLYEAEGSLCFHKKTYTYKFIFSNTNPFLLTTVLKQVKALGFNPHATKRDVQVSRKEEVQKLAVLLQFRHYDS